MRHFQKDHTGNLYFIYLHFALNTVDMTIVKKDDLL